MGIRRHDYSPLAIRGFAPDFAPALLSGLTFHLDAQKPLYQSAGGSLATADGDPVGQWPDQSTNALHVAQATTAAKPTLRTNVSAINNKNAVEADGGDSLTKASVNALTLSGAADVTIFAVLYQNSVQAQNALYGLVGAAEVFHGWVTYENTLYFDHNSRISVAQPAGWDNAWHLLMYRRTGTSSAEIYVDGALLLSSSMALSLSSSTGAWTVLSGAASYLGLLAEFWVYNRALSTGEVTSTKGYVAHKYGLTLA